MTDFDALVARLRAAGCVFAEDEARLMRADVRVIDPSASPPERERALESLVHRRVGGEPLETVLGWAEFFGLRIEVARGVFVPRRRSELLVSTALDLLFQPHSTVIDLCCGSGAIGAALLSRHPLLTLYASDIDERAVICAQRNLESRGGRVLQGDLLDALPQSLRGQIDLVAVNAPYVPTDEIDFMPSEAREWEPMIALDGGPDGLRLHRRIVRGATQWLRSGGQLLIETSALQAGSVIRMFDAAGLSARAVHDDEADATVVVGTLGAIGPSAAHQRKNGRPPKETARS